MPPEATTATPQDLSGEPQVSPKGQDASVQEVTDGQVDKVNSDASQEATPEVPTDPEVLKQSFLQAKELEKKLGQQGQELGELRKAKESLDWLKAQPWFVEEAQRRLNPQAALKTPPVQSDPDEPYEIPQTNAEFNQRVEAAIERKLQADPDKQVVREIKLEKEFTRLEGEGCTDIRAKRKEMTDLFVAMGQPQGVAIEDLYHQVKGRETRFANRNGGTKPAVPAIPKPSDEKAKMGTSSQGMVPVKTEMKVRTLAEASAKAIKDLGLDKD